MLQMMLNPPNHFNYLYELNEIPTILLKYQISFAQLN